MLVLGNMYAVIETGGKQYRVEKGDVLDVELLGKPPEEKVAFNKILLIADQENIKVGKPYIENAEVNAKILENVADKKVIIYKFRHKTGYRRKQGHRQKYSRILIEDIGG